jgi:hypothetical protein
LCVTDIRVTCCNPLITSLKFMLYLSMSMECRYNTTHTPISYLVGTSVRIISVCLVTLKKWSGKVMFWL